MKSLFFLSLLFISTPSLAQVSTPATAPPALRTMPSSEDLAAHSEGRIAAFKATLKLTPEQEKLWPAVENAMREESKARVARLANMKEWREKQATLNPIERLRQRAEMQTQSATRTKALADSLAPLYALLDEGQKRRLSQLLSRENRAGEFLQRNERGGFRERMREEAQPPR